MSSENLYLYAAYSYLSTWLNYDSRYSEKLCSEDANEGRAALEEMASYYKVTRSLPIIGGKKNPRESRLQAAYEELMRIEVKNDKKEAVRTLAEALKEKYKGGYPLSASSKMLWMKFRDTVIIYDSIVYGYLKRCTCCKLDRIQGCFYSNFCHVWEKHYEYHASSIREACGKVIASAAEVLPELGAKCVRAKDGRCDEWFSRRAFDHFILNVSGLRNSTDDHAIDPRTEGIK